MCWVHVLVEMAEFFGIGSRNTEKAGVTTKPGVEEDGFVVVSSEVRHWFGFIVLNTSGEVEYLAVELCKKGIINRRRIMIGSLPIRRLRDQASEEEVAS